MSFGLLGAGFSRFGMGAGGQAFNPLSTLAVPAGFDWVPPVTIYRNSDTGEYSTDYDPAPILVEGDPGVTTYYVDADTGSEANPGTALLPKASLRTISATRTTKLLIKARGTFYGNITGPVFLRHDTLCVEAWGGADCILTTETNGSFPLVWTDETGGVWSAPAPFAGFTVNALSGTDVEALTHYPLAASLAECQATPGSVYTSGSTHYVHTLTGASPATGHTIYNRNGSCCTLADRGYAMNVQFIGVDFRGGDTAFLVSGVDAYAKRIDFVGCSFKHAYNFAALHCTGNSTVVTYQCTAGPSRFDGFAYSAASALVPSALEIENIGRDNGYLSGPNQGSTTHSGGKIVRVNGQYYDNADQQIADVNTNTASWNVGCTAGPQRLASVGFLAGNGTGSPEMWLDGCTFTDVDYDVGVIGVDTKLYYRNMPLPTITPDSTGVVESY